MRSIEELRKVPEHEIKNLTKGELVSLALDMRVALLVLHLDVQSALNYMSGLSDSVHDSLEPRISATENMLEQMKKYIKQKVGV